MSYIILHAIIKHVSPYIINFVDRNNQTPLFLACEKSKDNTLSVVKLLLDNGAKELNKINTFNQTALWWACKRGNFDIVKILLENGATEHINLPANTQDAPSNARKISPLGMAFNRNYSDIFKILLEYGAKITSIGYEFKHLSSRSEDIKRIILKYEQEGKNKYLKYKLKYLNLKNYLKNIEG